MTYPSFEEYWPVMQAKKAAELATKFATIEEAFNALQSRESIQLLGSVLYPGQRLLRWEKTGSTCRPSTDGLPYSADREGYDTVGHGTVYYFHPSTLKEGDTIELDGRTWQVLFNHFKSGSPYSLAYQCIYLLEVTAQ